MSRTREWIGREGRPFIDGAIVVVGCRGLIRKEGGG